MDEKIKAIKEWLGTGSINLFGIPFAGKDTQGRVLAEFFKAPLVGGGDILRNHHDPKKIEKIMAAGGLIPSDYYFDMVVPYLSKPAFKGKPLVLDALGRAHGEEPTIIKAAEQSGHPIKAVVLLDIPEAEVWRRFEAAKKLDDREERTDDRREILKNRLEKFRTRTLPVIAYYRDKGLLIKIHGAQPREEVTEEILAKLAKLAA